MRLICIYLDRKICSAEWVKAVQKKERISFVTLTEEGTYEKEQMTIQELVEKPFLLTEQGAAYRYELERLLADRDLEIFPILEIGNTETIIHLLKKGMGYSFFAGIYSQRRIEEKAFIRNSDRYSYS